MAISEERAVPQARSGGRRLVRLGDEGGFTLVEVLVAIAIVGIAFAAILTGMTTVAIGSDVHRKLAAAETVLDSAAERIRDPDLPPVACAQVSNPGVTATYAASYLAAIREVTMPAGWDPATAVRITQILYEGGTSSGGLEFGAICRDTDALEHLLTLQLVTIEVRAPDGRATESVSVVKGDS